MRKLTATDTLDLSVPERIQLVEDIWDTIAVKADSVELTEEDKKIIDERLEAYHQNPNLGSPWEDVFERAGFKPAPTTRNHGGKQS
ncbi:addiction module protein [Dehalococcoidia bacterium]|nr:addiction module protein [Dehalococcoidia bacterium]